MLKTRQNRFLHNCLILCLRSFNTCLIISVIAFLGDEGCHGHSMLKSGLVHSHAVGTGETDVPEHTLFVEFRRILPTPGPTEALMLAHGVRLVVLAATAVASAPIRDHLQVQLVPILRL